jgi:hypothetical protein
VDLESDAARSRPCPEAPARRAPDTSRFDLPSVLADLGALDSPCRLAGEVPATVCLTAILLGH